MRDSISIETRHVFEVRQINRDLMEKALNMRCLAYLATVKSELLIETIFKIDSSKKKLRRDFDELMRLQEALRRQALIFENMSDAVVITGLDGLILDCNPSATRVFGYPKKELMEQDPALLLGTEGVKFIENEVAPKLENSEGWNGEASFVRSDGSKGVAELSVLPLKFMYNDEQHILTVWLYADITERKKSEEEKENLIGELKEALGKVKALSGMLPICASCKKIRDDKGYWTQIEAYLTEHSEADFTHGYCPECAKAFMEDVFKTD